MIAINEETAQILPAVMAALAAPEIGKVMHNAGYTNFTVEFTDSLVVLTVYRTWTGKDYSDGTFNPFYPWARRFGDLLPQFADMEWSESYGYTANHFDRWMFSSESLALGS